MKASSRSPESLPLRSAQDFGRHDRLRLAPYRRLLCPAVPGAGGLDKHRAGVLSRGERCGALVTGVGEPLDGSDHICHVGELPRCRVVPVSRGLSVCGEP
jgi:hypothetical protein